MAGSVKGGWCSRAGEKYCSPRRMRILFRLWEPGLVAAWWGLGAPAPGRASQSTPA